VSRAGNAVQAAEMVLIRLAYAADLPTPDELIARLADQPAPSLVQTTPVARNGGGGGQALRQPLSQEAPRSFSPAPAPEGAPRALAGPQTYLQLIALAGERRDLLLKHALEASLLPIAFAEGRIEVALAEGADPGIIQTLSARLKTWTGRNWMVSVSNQAPAGLTLREQQKQREADAKATAHEDPLVQAILETFPGARVMRVDVRPELPPAPPPETDAEIEARFDAEADFGSDDDIEDD